MYFLLLKLFILQLLLLDVILNINVFDSAFPHLKQISMTVQVIPVRTTGPVQTE